MIKYNLQFFAKDGPGGQKTEPATAKKLKDARKNFEEGTISQEKLTAVEDECILELVAKIKELGYPPH